MSKRQAIIDALNFRRPEYVPWAWGPTYDCAEKLKRHLGVDDLAEFIDPHTLSLDPAGLVWTETKPGHYRDTYGVTWDRTVDKDIGTPVDWPLKNPGDLDRYQFPNADNDEWYAYIPAAIDAAKDLFAVYNVHFSLFERAWTLRGMPDLLMDMIERPAFVDELLDAITEHNLQQIRHALQFNIDAVYFGDDYGAQRGLIMGGTHWRRFIKPRLARMFKPIRDAGLFVHIHSCGCVSELFDDLIEIGLSQFNPFQPEVMDVFEMLRRYRGRLAFHGGMSIQKVLPFGTEQEVRDAAQKLIDAGRDGGYVFSPSHAVPRDVPPQNLVAMVDVLKSQP